MSENNYGGDTGEGATSSAERVEVRSSGANSVLKYAVPTLVGAGLVAGVMLYVGNSVKSLREDIKDNNNNNVVQLVAAMSRYSQPTSSSPNVTITQPPITVNVDTSKFDTEAANTRKAIEAQTGVLTGLKDGQNKGFGGLNGVLTEILGELRKKPAEVPKVEPVKVEPVVPKPAKPEVKPTELPKVYAPTLRDITSFKHPVYGDVFAAFPLTRYNKDGEGKLSLVSGFTPIRVVYDNKGSFVFYDLTPRLEDYTNISVSEEDKSRPDLETLLVPLVIGEAARQEQAVMSGSKDASIENSYTFAQGISAAIKYAFPTAETGLGLALKDTTPVVDGLGREKAADVASLWATSEIVGPYRFANTIQGQYLNDLVPHNDSRMQTSCCGKTLDAVLLWSNNRNAKTGGTALNFNRDFAKNMETIKLEVLKDPKNSTPYCVFVDTALKTKEYLRTTLSGGNK